MSSENDRASASLPRSSKDTSANDTRMPNEGKSDYFISQHSPDLNPLNGEGHSMALPNGLPEVSRERPLCNGIVGGGEFLENPILPDVIPSVPGERRELSIRTEDRMCEYQTGNPDLLWIESGNASRSNRADNPADDMEGYFNANSHMLQDLHLEDHPRNHVTSSCHASNCNCVLQYHMSKRSNPTETHDIDDILEDGGCDVECAAWDNIDSVHGHLPNQSSPTPSSDDHGDFIEADIREPLRRNSSYTSSRSTESKDSATSSYEELPTLTLQDNEDPGDMSNEHDGGVLQNRELNSATCDHVCPSCNNLCQGQLYRKPSSRVDFQFDLVSRSNESDGRSNLGASSSSCSNSCRNSDGREADRPIAYVRPSILNPLACQRPYMDNSGAKLTSGTPNSESGSSYKTTSMSFQSPNCSECSPFDGTISEPSPFLSPDKDSENLDSEFEAHDAHSRYFEGVGARRKDPLGQANKKRSSSTSDAQSGASNLTPYTCDCSRRQSNPEATSCHQSRHGIEECENACDTQNDERDLMETPMRNIFYFRGPEIRQENDPHLVGQSDDSDPERYPISPPGVTERTFSNPPPGGENREPVVPSRRVRGVLMYHDYDNHPGNNLNPTIEVSPSEQQSQLFNVSRQTSTSNFDQDENSFQEMSVDSECECFSNVTSQSDSPPAIPGRPDLIGAASAESHYECVNLPDGAIGAQAASMDRRIVDEADAYEEVRHYTSDWIKKVSKFVDKHYVKKLMNEGKLYEDVEDPETREEANKIRDRNNTVDKVLNQSDEDRNVLYSIFVRDYVLGNLRSIHRPVWYIPTPDERDIERVMLWTEYQAYVLQIKQLGKSACGATSVANALKVFEIYADKEELCDSVVTNQRAESAPVGDYLLSRSIAGITANCLMRCLEKVTKGGLFSRFFCTYPPREIELRNWLGIWMKKGAVPILTLNLQRGVPPGYAVPDAWHHQMVYGVGPKGLYLTNPQEVIPERVIMEQLTSPSVLMVRRRDITTRWQEEADNLGPILHQSDPRWRELNVIGQILSVLREERSQPRVQGFRPRLTSHVTIPAWYQPGITLIVQRESSEYFDLINEPELPIKSEEIAADNASSAAEENQTGETNPSNPNTNS